MNIFEVKTKLFLLTIIGTLCMSYGQFTCDPATDCANSTAGAKVPDPYDCERFYYCIETVDGSLVPSSIPIKCPYGKYFDHTIQNCTDEAVPEVCDNLCHNHCENTCPDPFQQLTIIASRTNCTQYYYCGPAGPVVSECTPVAPYFDGVKCVADESRCCEFCGPYCERAGIQIVDPCDCTSFFVCTGVGEASDDTRGSCPVGTYYEVSTAQCISGTCTSLCSGDKCSI